MICYFEIQFCAAEKCNRVSDESGVLGIDESPRGNHGRGTAQRHAKVYIVILNWNQWRATIECLESIFRLHYPNFVVIVCDNASGDESLTRIEEWAHGRLQASCSSETLREMVTPPCTKPISSRRLALNDNANLGKCTEKLFLVQTGANLGFAGGTNVGLRLALAARDCDYAWVLNNDTVVSPTALTELVRRMEACPHAGIAGSTLLYYGQPSLVQAFGGSFYNKWTARGHHIGAGPRPAEAPHPEKVEAKLKYVVGASMLVRREFMEQIGLMSESYFIYFEEIDWATRAKSHFSLAWAPESLVYHKEGGSIGTAPQSHRQPINAEYYATRNRILFTRRFYPAALPSVFTSIAASFVVRLLRGHWGNAAAILRSCRDAFRSIDREES